MAQQVQTRVDGIANLHAALLSSPCPTFRASAAVVNTISMQRTALMSRSVCEQRAVALRGSSSIEPVDTLRVTGLEAAIT